MGPHTNILTLKNTLHLYNLKHSTVIQFKTKNLLLFKKKSSYGYIMNKKIFFIRYLLWAMVEISAKIRLRLAEDFLSIAKKSEKFFKIMFFLLKYFLFQFFSTKIVKKKKLLISSGRIFKSLPLKKKLRKKRKKRSLFLTLVMSITNLMIYKFLLHA